MSGRSLSKLQKDIIGEQPTCGVKDLTAKIYDEITRVTKRADKPQEAYVCLEDLRQIWSDRSRIAALLHPDRLPDTHLRFIQSHMILILSTFVCIGAAEGLAHFRERFFHNLNSSGLVEQQAKLTDDDIPLDEGQLDTVFLDSECALRSLFLEYQFRFKPVIIEVGKVQRKLVIADPRYRLPFESREEEVGAGSYGKVDCVGISPGHYIKKDVGVGSDWSTKSVYLVACKQIPLREDFNKEADNLDILNESLTRHHTVMKHLATIIHGRDRYILLPYAHYGDLELFLHRGYDSRSMKKYDFNKYFNEIDGSQEDIMAPLLRQCWSLASALDWLHKGIKIVQSSRTVFCAHMDLKPANILIQHDKTSKVGRWMISDFGISVFKEETKPQAAPIGSIGDYYSQLTINTRPKRHEGTYQAPDVMREGIGRKSDIWSYGCILTEVLAFALGSAGLVTGFQSARESGERNDYFYSEVGMSQAYLTVPATTRPRYIVRPSVLKWLEDICKNSANPQRWVDCYVETAKKIILIDVDKRPDSTVVLTLVEHVLKHVQDSRLGSPVDCHVLKLNNEDYIVPGPQSPGTETEHPKLDKSSTNIQNPTAIPPTIWDDNQESIGKRKDALVTVTEDEVTTPPPPTTNPTHGRSSPLSDGSDQTISGPEPEEKSIVSDPTTSTVTGFSTTSTPYAKPANRHGVTMEDKVVMSPKISICVAVPKQKKWSKATWVSVTSLNGSNKEVRVAYLVKSVVYLYRINFQDGVKGTLEQEINLKPADGWTGVAIQNDYLVVWGFSTRKLLHFCDIQKPQNPAELLLTEKMDMLNKVTVSKQGIAALVCGGRILILSLNSQAANRTLSAQYRDQVFTDASFNESGDLLFAWAYGQKDSLYVWPCDQGVINERTNTESHYGTIKKGKPYDPFLTTLLPYPTYLGCIIRTPDNKFFPAHIRSSLRGTAPTLSHEHEVDLPYVKAACVFNDYSVVTIESETLRHRQVLKGRRQVLNEYKILWNSLHLIQVPGEKITTLTKSADEGSVLCIVKAGTGVGEGCTIVVCNLDGVVEVVGMVAKT